MQDMLRVILHAQEETGYFDGTGHPEDGKFRGWHLWKRAMENCVTNYWLRLSETLFRLTGELQYAEAMEKTIFNQLLAQQSPDGLRMSYYQAMNGTKRYDMDCPYPYEWAHCCHGSAMRTFSRMPLFMAYRKADGLAIILYDNFRFPYGNGTIRVETAFPASGTIRLCLNCSGALRLYLRIPRWSAGGGTLHFRNEVLHAPTGSFLCLSQTVRSGETAVLTLAPSPRAIQGRGESEGRTLFLYGPLVLAQEGAAACAAFIFSPMFSG